MSFPLTSAETWDLANPLETCSLLVEIRGDSLFLDFLHGEEGKLFAQSKIAIKESGFNLSHWLEQAVDTSRYFALKIQGAGGREALIGFGFRDREQATDLRESLQHYNKSIARENEAKALSASSYTVPRLEEGEKIHVNIACGKLKEPKKKSGGGGPFLLKKPPPPPASG